jgi:hypothetical protein
VPGRYFSGGLPGNPKDILWGRKLQWGFRTIPSATLEKHNFTLGPRIMKRIDIRKRNSP